MHWISSRSRSSAVVLTFTLVFLAASAAPARADITAFLGLSPTPENHAVKGFSAGIGLLIVGFEFEYANLSEDAFEALPGLKTYAGNVLVQTPVDIVGTQFYATVGAQGYQETLGLLEESHFGTNIGGGAKIKLIGPVRVRVDYRIFKLQGSPIHDVYQRFYVGANLKF
jgi:hypothetical protein